MRLSSVEGSRRSRGVLVGGLQDTMMIMLSGLPVRVELPLSWSDIVGSADDHIGGHSEPKSWALTSSDIRPSSKISDRLEVLWRSLIQFLGLLTRICGILPRWTLSAVWCRRDVLYCREPDSADIYPKQLSFKFLRRRQLRGRSNGDWNMEWNFERAAKPSSSLVLELSTVS